MRRRVIIRKSGLLALTKTVKRTGSHGQWDSNDKVQQMLKFGTVETKLLVQWLHLWQRIVTKPKHHKQSISSFFGSFRFNETSRFTGAANQNHTAAR